MRKFTYEAQQCHGAAERDAADSGARPARADGGAAGIARRSASRSPRPAWSASTTSCRSTTPSRRSMAWSRTCRCAWAKPWCRAFRTRPRSTIMTIADMSLITAEVKVDETDIVNVKLGQAADVTIDAIPEQDLQGPRDRNRQHGDPALHRRGGQPKRDFEPGSQGFQGGGGAGQSAGRNSARTFLHRKDHHSHPEERPYHSDPGADGPSEGATGAETGQRKGCASRSHQARSGRGEGEEGRDSRRFRRPGGKAVFKKVETGITGATEIEVLSGLNDGDQIVTGSYQVIRTIGTRRR